MKIAISAKNLLNNLILRTLLFPKPVFTTLEKVVHLLLVCRIDGQKHQDVPRGQKQHQ